MIEANKYQEPVKPASPEETRERIMSAAREVMARKGKRGATTREIADVAGVNEATLFRHFGNKDALIVATAQRFCGVVELKGVISELNGPVEKDLFVIGDTVLSRMEALSDLMRWSLVEEEYEKSVFAQAAWRPQMALHGVLVAYMEEQVAKGVLRGNPSELGLLFLGMLFAHVMSRKKFPDVALLADREASLRFYIDVFLNGVRSK
jgi:AcrR family transcriptional regulator